MLFYCVANIFFKTLAWIFRGSPPNPLVWTIKNYKNVDTLYKFSERGLNLWERHY